MKTLFGICFLLGFLINDTLTLPSRRGACVVTCSPGVGMFDDLGLSECSPGYTCQSNGCGAVCTLDTGNTHHSCQSTGCIPVHFEISKTHHGLSLGKRGVCAIHCSPLTGLYDDLNLPDCPDRYYCVSTGCGAMCRPYI